MSDYRYLSHGRIAIALLFSLTLSACNVVDDDYVGGQLIQDDPVDLSVSPVELPENPDEPSDLPDPLNIINQPPTISGEAPDATQDVYYRFTPTVEDADGDELTVTVTNLPGWLGYDSATYSISGTPSAADVGRTPEITYTVSDGKAEDSMSFSIVVDESDLQRALRTGDYRYVQDPNDFADSALGALTSNIIEGQSIKTRLFNLNGNGQARADGSSLTAIDWYPTHDASLLTSTFGFNHDVLVSNSVFVDGYAVENLTLGVAGEQAGANRNARFLALGGNPMRSTNTVNTEMDQFLKNSISWLSGRDNFAEQALKVVIAQTAQSYYFPDETSNRDWLDANYPEQVVYNSADSCDSEALASCLTDDVDLLIISQYSEDETKNGEVEAAVKAWLDAGKPVLYLHYYRSHEDLGKRLFRLLDIGYNGSNYWKKQQLENFNPVDYYDAAPTNITAIADLVQRMKNEDFSIDMTACSDKSCEDSSGFNAQFQDGADAMRQLFLALDQQKIRLFDEAGYIFQKSLILLADSYRQTATYPMDKLATPQMDFLKSYFADHARYLQRDINAAQADMGNFSRSDFSHITPVDKQITLNSKQYFRAAGVYALPGQTVTVTRTDNAAVNTTVFINTQRDGATHQFNENGYTRPKYLKTVVLDIAPGETLSFTSAYGGPIQIGFDSNDQSVSFSFQNVGEHPYWNGSEDNSRFEAALAAGDYDWAEVSTAGFEVHSKLDKMRESMNGPSWNDAAGLAAATERYMSNLPHVLAGFQGPGIDVVSEIHNFADDNGWTIDTIDVVKHMNADQATCGYGCSGNPYDAYWSYSPVGHGDLHELGHGLESGRFRFAGWEYHASTNPYSYYSKSQFHQDTGEDPSCQSLPFSDLKQTLLDSRDSADPFAYMQAADLSSWSEGVAIYIQMMMSAQAEGILQNGWHLLARLHILEREFKRADNDDSSWLAKRDSLGFGQFTRTEATALSNNDWLLVALSKVLGRDMRDYLSMWGLGYNRAAADQVGSQGYSAMPTNFYDSSATGYCLSLDQAAVTIN